MKMYINMFILSICEVYQNILKLFSIKSLMSERKRESMTSPIKFQISQCNISLLELRLGVGISGKENVYTSRIEIVKTSGNNKIKDLEIKKSKYPERK